MSAVVLDFNGDGEMDLAVTHSADNDLTVWIGNGYGGFSGAHGFSVGSVGMRPLGLVAADFNGDGLADLAIANSGSGTVSVLLGSSAAVLMVTAANAGNFTQGQTNAIYIVTVFNPSLNSTNGPVTVTEALPPGLTLVSMAGAGWSCGGASCTRSDVLNSGASYPAITVTVNVADNASSPQVNTVSVSGGGSALISSFPDPTTILVPPHPPFFTGEVSLGSGVYYLTFPDGNLFGYYEYLAGSFIYHYDMGFEYVFPTNDGFGDVYFYDFQSGHWWYTGPSLFQSIYDFTLGAWIYYFPDPSNPGHYTTNPRKFAYDATHVMFTM
jgi:uncharacterized repeat protein (TIGR01451 family)